MVKIPYKDRIEFWKFQHASITFGEANKLCDHIIKEKIDSNHPLHASLMTALHIFYGRPFKQRTAKLTEEIVPKNYKDTHESLISMRDQIYAHMDVDGPKSIQNNPINKIGVFVDSNGVRFGMTMAFPRNVEKIRDLTAILSEKTHYHAKKIWWRYFKKQTISANNYEVNLSKDDDTFLKPISF